MGDLWLIPGASTNPVVLVDGKSLGGTKSFTRVQKKNLAEHPHGQWNQVALVVLDDSFEHWVNGILLMRGRSPELKTGKIQIQSEGAAIEYRKLHLEATKAESAVNQSSQSQPRK